MFKDVQAQYARFQEADDNRIKEEYAMNVAEAQELVEKIMHCDEVIHLQQLSIPWKRPTEPIFSFLSDPSQQNQDGGDGDDGASAAQGNNASLMDSEMKGQSRSNLGDDEEQQSMATGNAEQVKEKYDKIKNVFKLLIDEAPFLIDDNCFDKAEGKTPKEQFAIYIDAIRKALGITSMEDVDLLVEVFYGFESQYEKEQLDQEKELLEDISDLEDNEKEEWLAENRNMARK